MDRLKGASGTAVLPLAKLTAEGLSHRTHPIPFAGATLIG
jgi:hypothetical protein